MNEPLRTLIVEDLEDDALLMVEALRREGFEVSFTRVETEESFLHELQSERWDLILCDYNLPSYSAIKALQAMKENGVDMPFLVVSGTIGEEKAVELMRAGAQDYVSKESLFRLAPAVERELRDGKIRRQNRRSQAAIRENEARFRSMSENTPDAIVIINASGIIEYWNPKAGEMFGYTPAEAVGETVGIIIPENQIEKHRKGIERVLKTGETKIIGRTVQVEGQRKDGTLFPLELSLAMWTQADRPYFSAVLRDITERMQAEAKTLRMLKQQTTINELAVEIGVTSDLNQIYHNIYSHIQNLMDAWGFAVSSFNNETKLIQAEYVIFDGVTLNVENLPPISLAEPGRGGQSRVIHTGEPFYSPDYRETKKTSQKEYIVEKDGTFTEGPPPDDDQEDTAKSTLYVPMKIAGETEGVMQLQSPRLNAYSPEDITLLSTLANVAAGVIHRARAEKALREHSVRLEEMVEERTQDLREAQEELVRKEKMATLGQLGGGVAHELRNPLGVISNAVYFLKSTLTDADDITVEYLDMITSEIGGATQIINNLLSLTRKEEPSMEETLVAELVARGLVHRAPPGEVKVSTEISDDMLSVFADPSQIAQVIENLLSNAYQAMPDGGELTIKAWEENNTVLISVADTGSGIPEENLSEIFEPLFTTKARGIGLGLALSRDLLGLNHGRIEVESVVGQGTTFTLRLPGVS